MHLLLFSLVTRLLAERAILADKATTADGDGWCSIYSYSVIKVLGVMFIFFLWFVQSLRWLR